MQKFLLAILFTIATFAVVAHGILVYQLSATATMIAEDEKTDDKPYVKEAKEISKESIGFSYPFYHQDGLSALCEAGSDDSLNYSKGFYRKPYNPPDFI